MQSFIIAYFIINTIGAIYILIKDIVDRKQSNGNDELEEVYQSLNQTSKILVYLFAFIVNVIIGVPLLLIRTLIKGLKSSQA